MIKRFNFVIVIYNRIRIWNAKALIGIYLLMYVSQINNYLIIYMICIIVLPWEIEIDQHEQYYLNTLAHVHLLWDLLLKLLTCHS